MPLIFIGFLFLIAAIAIFFVFLRKLKPSIKLSKSASVHSKTLKIISNFSILRGFKIIKSFFNFDNSIIPGLSTLELPYNSIANNDIFKSYILIGEFGIVLILSCSTYGEIYSSDSNLWNNFISGRKSSFLNPSIVINYHTSLLRNIFAKNKIFNVNILPAVVFSHNNASLYISDNFTIFNCKSFKKFLNSSKLEINNNLDINLIYETLINYSSNDNKTL